MKSSFQFKKAGTEHIRNLVDLRIAFLEDYWGPQYQDKRETLSIPLLRYFEKSIPEKTYISYLAFEESKIVGIGGIVFREQPGGFKNPTGKVAYVMNMYTLPEYRKKGIAGHILKLLIEDACRMGYSVFELHATKDGEPIYIKEGFELHPEPTYRKII